MVDFKITMVPAHDEDGEDHTSIVARLRRELPDLPAYASGAESDAWQERLLQLLADEEACAAAREQQRAEKDNENQSRLW